MEETRIAKKGLFFNIQWTFSAIAVFAITTLSLGSLGLMPETPGAVAEASSKSEKVVIEDTVPNRIVIDEIGVDALIMNPASTQVSVLDEALLKGVVRYPGAADLGQEGNMFLFGHSSGRPVIYNPSFKVFNNLSKLEAGDLVRVRSTTHENVYRVSTIRFAPADDVTVKLLGTKKMLTISTCDSFGAKSDRIIVEAEYMGTYPILSETGHNNS